MTSVACRLSCLVNLRSALVAAVLERIRQHLIAFTEYSGRADACRNRTGKRQQRLNVSRDERERVYSKGGCVYGYSCAAAVCSHRCAVTPAPTPRRSGATRPVNLAVQLTSYTRCAMLVDIQTVCDGLHSTAGRQVTRWVVNNGSLEQWRKECSLRTAVGSI